MFRLPKRSLSYEADTGERGYIAKITVLRTGLLLWKVMYDDRLIHHVPEGAKVTSFADKLAGIVKEIRIQS